MLDALKKANKKLPVPSAAVTAARAETQNNGGIPAPQKTEASQPAVIVESPLKSVKIEWNEGVPEGDYTGRTFYNWTAFEMVLKNIYDLNDCNVTTANGCYEKVKAVIEWENGKSITDRIDVGFKKGNFNPYREHIGDYLKTATSAMYNSNLKVGDRLTMLEFEDAAFFNVTAEEIAPNPLQPPVQPTLTADDLLYRNSLMQEMAAEDTPQTAPPPPPVSKPTVEDVFGPTQPAPKDIELVVYSQWAFAIYGEGTREYRKRLADFGNWRRLVYNRDTDEKRMGWVFPNKHRDAVEAILNGEADDVAEPTNEAIEFLRWTVREGWYHEGEDDREFVNANDYSAATGYQLYKLFKP